jgi:hypothetical protein
MRDSFIHQITPNIPNFNSKNSSRIHLKNVDQGSWLGAVRLKSRVFEHTRLVCEHFEPGRNTAMGP